MVGSIFMKVTFLGTGAGIPSKNRNVTAVVLDLLAEKNELWLFDCGEATQHQLLYTTLKPRKVTKIFISHLHGDHIFGLPGFLSSRSFQDGTEPLTIYGPKGIKQFVETTLGISTTHLTYPIHYIELENSGHVYQDDSFTVDCLELDHGIQSFGYRIIEKDKLGSLQTEKLQALGIQPGPIYQKIKENEVTILQDGTSIWREDYLGPMKKGKKLVIFGDTRYRMEHAAFASKADLIIHEATFSHEMEDIAKNYYHSTTKQAANLAAKAKVNTLIITHISSRYQHTETLELLEEARTIFPSTIIAKDFYTYELL